MTMKRSRHGAKWMEGPCTRSRKHSNGKRRGIKAIETRTRKECRKACQEVSDE